MYISMDMMDVLRGKLGRKRGRGVVKVGGITARDLASFMPSRPITAAWMDA